jgi:DNA adenine methylase
MIQVKVINSDLNKQILTSKLNSEPERLSFIKWAGGKKQLIPIISQNLPKKIENYFEPFIGGGAIFFYILQKYQPKRAYISDINSKLITTYKVVRDNVEELIIYLQKHKDNHFLDYENFGSDLADKLNELNKLKKNLIIDSFEYNKNIQEASELRKLKREVDKKRYYYLQRDNFNDNLEKLSDVEIAAYFIYFNKSGFNGMYRESPSGKFNIPMGSSKDVSFNYERLRKTSELLNNSNTEIRVASFKEIESLVCENSFIYMDPPYDPLKKNKSFTGYTKDGFSDDDQRDVLNLFKILDKKNCKVLLSNSNTEFMNNLYSDFKILKVDALRSINADGLNRGKIKEILVKNY